MEVSHDNNSTSYLAKLLATENITVRHSAQAKTAWFDVKSRVLMLPIWREMSLDLRDMLVVHEVGHALDTPPDGWLDAIKDIATRVMGTASNRAMGAVKGFLNVVEDARIDKRQKRRFPGARRNYVKGYQELIEKDFFGTKTKDINSMIFIDRLNIYFKGGAMLGIKFTPEEKAMLAKVEAAETFDEVLKLTEEIFRWSKEHMQDTPETEKGDDFRYEESEDGDEYDDSDDYDEDEDEEGEETSGKSSNKSEDDEDSEDEEEGDTDDDGQSSDGEDEKTSEEKSKDPIDMGSQDKNDVPESETEKAWQERQNDLILDSDEEYIYVKIPRPINYDKVVNDYKLVLADQRSCIGNFYNPEWLSTVRADLQKFKTAEKASISFMVKEFEMRKSADEYSRTSIAKTGVIDTNKLHSYKYNDDLFRRITTVASGKNHGFVMFVDWSGSMNNHLQKTVKQLISLTMFCKQVQIPFEVYSFRSALSWDYDKGRVGNDRLFTDREGELDFDNFIARNLLSSRMNTAEFNDAMFALYVMGCGGGLSCDSLMSTPLNECIGTADLIVNKFKARSKVQIVNTIFLTDGASDPIGQVHKVNTYGIKKKRFILQDEITKKSYDIRIDNATVDRSAYWSSQQPYNYNKVMTPMLLNVLKDRVGGNLLGFFISSDGFKRNYEQFNGQYGKVYDKAKEDWTSSGFFGVTSAGYDEYYILDAKKLDVTVGNLDVNSSMTNNKIAKEFIKFSEKKSVSRVLLSRFVKRIAA
jgi:hypothetical protein